MKVISLETFPISVPLISGAKIADHPLGIPSLSYVLVRAETSDGRIGWGEICDGWGYEYPGVAAALVDEALSRFVIGQSPADVALLVQRMWAWLRRRQGTSWLVAQAVGGVEIALWDLAARDAGAPISALIGRPLRDRVPVYAGGNFLGQMDTDAHAKFYRPALARGVDTIKVRIGVDWEDHLEVLGELHGLLGPGVAIGVDGNEAFQAKTSLRIAERMADLGGSFFEEPMPRNDRTGLARLVERSSIPIAYGEHVHRAAGFRLLEEQGPPADVWQPDVTVMGGFIEAGATYALAADIGRPISPHSATTPLGLAGNLHSAGGAPTLTHVEYGVTAIAKLLPYFSGGEQRALDAIEGGSLRLPSGPGLGVTPNLDHLQDAFPLVRSGPVDSMPAFYVGSV